MERFKVPVGLFLILRQGKQVYLQLRKNASFAGQYCFIAGHLDGNETLKDGMIREAREEVGIDIKPADLNLRLILHHDAGEEYLQFYFECHRWQGTVCNCEPEKCGDIIVADWDKLPDNVPIFIQRAVAAINEGVILREEMK